MIARAGAALAATLIVMALAAPQAGAATNFEGATPDAATIYFSSDEQLVAADTDSPLAVYSRSGGVTALVSAPGVGASGPGVVAPRPDGTKDFFVSNENTGRGDTNAALNDSLPTALRPYHTLISGPGVGPAGRGHTFNTVSAGRSTASSS